ncbi:MAG TPA: hypothetical protein VM532_01440, partial [Burkholderiales bacterium]|nr:hypothetical protein [Burkholderiales bacterium]
MSWYGRVRRQSSQIIAAPLGALQKRQSWGNKLRTKLGLLFKKKVGKIDNIHGHRQSCRYSTDRRPPYHAMNSIQLKEVVPSQSSEGGISVEEVEALFGLPFNDLIYRAQSVHRKNFDPNEVQLSTLLSIKTGGCSEDCGYCPQAARYDTGVNN